MAKFRTMLGDRFIEVDAIDELAAQEQAFAKHVRDLSPADFTICGDEWVTADNPEAAP